jgi:hypothetical protein
MVRLAAAGEGPGTPGVRGLEPAGVPQLPQNLKPGCMGAPQAAQESAGPWPGGGAAGLMGWPQSRQKAKLGSFSRPHRSHFTGFDIPPFRHAGPRRSTRPVPRAPAV